jgi:short-subunit dehydrogenase
MRLSKKIAVITGTGRGIGESTAYRFADEGADLILTARTRQQLDRVADCGLRVVGCGLRVTGCGLRVEDKMGRRQTAKGKWHRAKGGWKVEFGMQKREY